MKWVSDFLIGISSVCAVMAIVECITSDESISSGFRFLCGSVTAAVIVRNLIAAIDALF